MRLKTNPFNSIGLLRNLHKWCFANVQFLLLAASNYSSMFCLTCKSNFIYVGKFKSTRKISQVRRFLLDWPNIWTDWNFFNLGVCWRKLISSNRVEHNGFRGNGHFPDWQLLKKIWTEKQKINLKAKKVFFCYRSCQNFWHQIFFKLIKNVSDFQ